MEDIYWVLDEFHFFRSRVYRTLRDDSRGLGIPGILSKTLLKCTFLVFGFCLLFFQRGGVKGEERGAEM